MINRNTVSIDLANNRNQAVQIRLFVPNGANNNLPYVASLTTFLIPDYKSSTTQRHITTQQQVAEQYENDRTVRYISTVVAPPQSILSTTLRMGTWIPTLANIANLTRQILNNIDEPVIASMYLLALKIYQLSATQIDLAIMNTPQGRANLLNYLKNRIPNVLQNIVSYRGQQITVDQYFEYVKNLSVQYRCPNIQYVEDPGSNNAVRPSGIATPFLRLIMHELSRTFQFYGLNTTHAIDPSRRYVAPYLPGGIQYDPAKIKILVMVYRTRIQYNRNNDLIVNVPPINLPGDDESTMDEENMPPERVDEMFDMVLPIP